MQENRQALRFFSLLTLFLSCCFLVIVGCTQQQVTALPGEPTMDISNEENVLPICDGCGGVWGPLSLAVGNLDTEWVADDHGIKHLLYRALLTIWRDNNTEPAQQFWIYEEQEVVYDEYRIKFLRVDAEPGFNTTEYIVLSIEEIGDQ